MIAVLLLAGTCAWIPSYGGVGATCTTTNESVECRCDECFQWSPGPVDANGDDPTEYYEVQRTDMDGTIHLQQIAPLGDCDGTPCTPVPTPIWCPAKHDESMPYEGRTYRYIFRACNVAGCSAWSEEHIYIGAPYAINQFRPPVQGN